MRGAQLLNSHVFEHGECNGESIENVSGPKLLAQAAVQRMEKGLGSWYGATIREGLWIEHEVECRE